MEFNQDLTNQQEVLVMRPTDDLTQSADSSIPITEEAQVTSSQSGMDVEDHKTSSNPEEKKQDTGEFSDIELVKGQDAYKELIDNNMLCDGKIWKRVLREVQEVNSNFGTLKTCIGVVADMTGALHFLLYPGDGAMADKPLCGRILIPKEYPIVPPVVHLLTRTNRFNVDIYHNYGQPHSLRSMHSSMCFDILRSRSHGGIWESEYTLSALVSSLLQAIVTINVLQEGGGTVAEFVSMEKLNSVHHSIEQTYATYKDVMPTRKEIVHQQPKSVPTKYFELPEKVTSNKNNQDLIIKSNPISLQVPVDQMSNNVYSIGFDLSDLRTNPSTVFSLILSNAPLDPVGKKGDTILIRNGITATAAKKKAGKTTDWFYHGKPMNEANLKLVVTVGHDQFCITNVNGDRQAIHGDFPVSALTSAEIGSVGKQQFYLSMFLKNKGGATVTVKTFRPECGYIHPGASTDAK